MADSDVDTVYYWAGANNDGEHRSVARHRADSGTRSYAQCYGGASVGPGQNGTRVHCRHALSAQKRTPWNKGKVIGAKPPLRPHVWSVRTKLQVEGRARDLAMFNL
jgi:hypothetical protein